MRPLIFVRETIDYDGECFTTVTKVLYVLWIPVFGYSVLKVK